MEDERSYFFPKFSMDNQSSLRVKGRKREREVGPKKRGYPLLRLQLLLPFLLLPPVMGKARRLKSIFGLPTAIILEEKRTVCL